MRVEGPGTALEFNPGKEPVNREAAVRPPVGERPREEKPTGNKTNLINEAKINETGSDQLESAVELTNKAMEVSNFGLQFRIHEHSGRVQVKVVDSATKEVIREIPPEQMLEISAQIADMLKSFHKMVGVLVNEIV